jgi:hypothetical protein
MQSTPRPQRKAAAKAAFNMATAGVPDRDSRPTKPPQAQAPADPQPPVAPEEPVVLHAPVEASKEPAVLHAAVEASKEPAVLHAAVEAPSKPPMYRAGRQKKPLRPKPRLLTELELYKMSKAEVIDYCHMHHLRVYKSDRKTDLIFTVIERVGLPAPVHIANLTQLAQVAPVNTLPARVKKQPRLCA